VLQKIQEDHSNLIQSSSNPFSQLMKILHISYLDTSGGAAKTAFRLHKGLTSIGVEFRMLVAKVTSFEDEVFHYPARKKKKPHRLLKTWSSYKNVNRESTHFRPESAHLNHS